jgi:hypothetical protein
MNTRVLLLLPLAICLAGCSLQKSSPLAPSRTETTGISGPSGGAASYLTNGPDLIAYIAARYPERLVGGISRDERIQNMMFLRDRIIEAGKCGGIDLGWNLKRGGPDVSIDFITERRDGTVYGHDIAFDYDNTDHALELYWGDGDFPTYTEFPEPVCR